MAVLSIGKYSAARYHNTLEIYCIVVCAVDLCPIHFFIFSSSLQGSWIKTDRLMLKTFLFAM